MFKLVRKEGDEYGIYDSSFLLSDEWEVVSEEEFVDATDAYEYLASMNKDVYDWHGDVTSYGYVLWLITDRLKQEEDVLLFWNGEIVGRDIQFVEDFSDAAIFDSIEEAQQALRSLGFTYEFVWRQRITQTCDIG